MPNRLSRALAAALLLLGLTLTGAQAGGWATIVADSTNPPQPNAGEKFTFGFTVLQHGVTPVDWGQPLVMLVNGETGQRVTVEAHQSGAKGHWSAELTVPSAGSWTLDIRHDLEVVPVDFQPIVVGGPAAAAPQASTGGLISAPALLAVAAFLSMLLIAAGALGMIAWRRTRTGAAGI